MAETIRMGGLELRFLRSKDETGGSLDLFEMTVQPNARMPVAHYHRDWDETIYALQGTTTWTLAGEDRDLALGECVFIPRGTIHAFRNRGTETATCLCVLTPGVLGPAFFREMAALVAAGPPDLAAMKATMLRHGLVPA